MERDRRGIKERLDKIREEFFAQIKEISSPVQMQEIKARYIGRKGELTQLLKGLKDLSPDERPHIGRLVNDLKKEIQSFIQQVSLSFSFLQGKKEDITLPGVFSSLGHLHPLTQVINQIEDIFKRLNFRVVEGQEIEDEYHNFEALNIPLDHPSRDAFDTFYLNSPEHLLLRSQTSTVQIRVMEKEKPPLRIISVRRVFGPDATDASHSCVFHQVEGFMVDKEVSLANLKAILAEFISQMFGEEVKMRFRAHYFPFTEPSAEVDISCLLCKGRGCSVCASKGWLEILGAGMIHPRVFEKVGYDPEKVSGFAFGMGVERIAMLKFNIQDIRLFFENDIRFLQQF